MSSVRFLSVLTVLVVAAFVSLPAHAQCEMETAGKKKQCSSGEMVSAKSDIVDTAMSSEDFTTLVAAVKAAGLVEALKGDGPFTVFAPTNAAFDALPKGTLASLLEPRNKDKLTAILTYHVVPGRVLAEDVVKITGATSLNGQRINVKVSDGGVMVDGANVVKTDLECSNGVIHVIDSVILPASDNIVATAKSAGAFGTLLTAAMKAGLAETLADGGPFTVLAPTDEAFAKLPAGTMESLLKPENKDQLVAILKFHVIPGRVYDDAAIKAGTAKTLAGKSVKIKKLGNSLNIQGASVVTSNLDASNGVIHVIDTVLIPQ